jgi:hypothetical protein
MSGSFISKLPFAAIKSAFIWPIMITLMFTSLNSILIMFDKIIDEKKKKKL